MSHRINFIGRLTSDPESRFTPSGVQVCNFRAAESKKVSKATTPSCPNGWKESYNKKAWELTVFWNVTAWRGLAETCNQYLAKGRQVYVEAELGGTPTNGILNPRIWTGNDGVPRANFEVTARSVEFLGSQNGGGNGHSETVEDEPPPGYVETPDSGIPF